MSKRDGYPHGVPHWTTCLVHDVTKATEFYGRVFGWSFDFTPNGDYAEATVRGRAVAGIASLAAAGPHAQPGWITEICVDDAAAAAAAIVRAGGAVQGNPVDLSPASILTIATDPSGAVLGVTQPLARKGAQLVNEPSTLTMSTLLTPDPAAVAEFYRDVFGWRIQQSGSRTLWQLPQYVGGETVQPVDRDIIAVAKSSTGPPRWDVDFRVADADAVSSTVREAGGSVLKEPMDLDAVPFREAVFADLDGSPFTVSQLRD
ncbi:MAG: VOC family protein [Rhodoglobus sp.]